VNVLSAAELEILLWIRMNLAGGGAADRIMVFFTTLGNLGFIWVLSGLILLLLPAHRRNGLILLAALLAGVLLGEGILKHLVMRPRPFTLLPELNLLIPPPGTWSFPSGHTTSSAAAAVVLGRVYPRWKWPVALVAGLIALSRLYLTVHYPTDILAGGVLGFLCAAGALRLLGKTASGISGKPEKEEKQHGYH